MVAECDIFRQAGNECALSNELLTVCVVEQNIAILKIETNKING